MNSEKNYFNEPLTTLRVIMVNRVAGTIDLCTKNKPAISCVVDPGRAISASKTQDSNDMNHLNYGR
ncbi:MAG: hypothetical protein WCR20_08895, partial [Verrucomicrobiota bacterium]